MLESGDITSIISLGLLCFTIYAAVINYLKQSEKLQRREHEQELLKVRLYTDRDIKTAQIENTALAQGFQEENSMSNLVSMALQNPTMIKDLLEKFNK